MKKNEALERRKHEIEELYGDFTPLDPDMHGNYRTYSVEQNHDTL